MFSFIYCVSSPAWSSNCFFLKAVLYVDISLTTHWLVSIFEFIPILGMENPLDVAETRGLD